MKRQPSLWTWFVSLAYLHSVAGCEGVQLVRRAEWGGRPAGGTEEMATPVPHLFVHHTATAFCGDQDSCSRAVRGIQNFHMDDRGWFDVGYNFLIGGDGRVYEGRGWDKVGAHTYGFNRNSVAFSLVGNFVEQAPPKSMLDAAKGMIDCARTQNYTTEDFRIHGHRDAGNTECPGQALYDIIKTWDRFQAGPLFG